MRSITSDSSQANRIGDTNIQGYLWFCLPLIVIGRTVFLFYKRSTYKSDVYLQIEKLIFGETTFFFALFSNEINAT